MNAPALDQETTFARRLLSYYRERTREDREDSPLDDETANTIESAIHNAAHGDFDVALVRLDTPGPSVRPSRTETERLRLLEAKITALWQAPAERKRGMNYPEAIIGEPIVPLSVVANRLTSLVPFRGMTPRARAEWVRDHLDIVGCTYLNRHEARVEYGCAAELIRIEG